MKQRLRPLNLLLTLAILVITALIPVSCTKESDTPEPDLKPGDVVTDFKKVTQYSATKQFQTDLDALVTYAFDIRAVRWAYYEMASKGGEKPFSATPDDMDNNEKCKSGAKNLYDMIDQIVERASQYEEALQRLEDSEVLIRPTATTRGVLSDAWDFITGCKQTQTMGRKSVVTIMRELGWTNDAKKLKEVYDGLPSDLKRGYNNSNDFWRDFSKGNLDSRANQVFVNVYNYADPEFGDKARDLGVTPGKNVTVVGAQLIEKGAALVIDASPMSTQLGYGKDLFSAAKATEDLVTKGEVKGFLQNVAGNLINYGRDAAKLAHQLQGLDIIYWEAADNFWDNFGKDAATIYMNDVAFGDLEKDGAELIPNMVRTRDKNGQEINLLVMVDTQSGKTIISYMFDKDGNIIANPELPGQKQITVVNRNTGKRTTKTVPVKKDEETIVETEFDEVQLEENPKDGYIEMRPTTLSDQGTGGNYKAMIVTNYLYYTCKTDDEWVSANVASDVNYLYVRLAKNETGQERKGKVTVSATDSKGKVLKSTVLTVVQTLPEPTEYWVSATPSAVQFDSDGGKKEVIIEHSNELPYKQVVVGDDLVGWCSLNWKETAVGWNIEIDASPNNKGEERSGSFTVIAAYDQKSLDAAVNGNFDPNMAAKTVVIVKQDPPSDIEVKGIKVVCVGNTTWKDETGQSGGMEGMTFRFDTSNYPDCKITTSTKGKSLHISGKGKGDTNNGGYEVEFSFDIDDYSALADHKAKIFNLNIKSKDVENDVTSLEIKTLEIEASDFGWNNFWGDFRGTGSKLISLKQKKTIEFDSGRTTFTEYILKDSDTNSIQMDVKFK